MIPITSETLLIVFLLFCRIGGCLMLMPGFSSTRVPVQIRLFLTVAITLALTPVLFPTVRTALGDPTPPMVLRLIFSELFTGTLIGLIGRLFFMALQFMATAAAQFAGFSPLPGNPIEDTEPLPALTTLGDPACADRVLHGHPAHGADRHRAGTREAGGCLLDDLCPGTADQQPIHRVCADRQSHGRYRQQARATDTGVFHRNAVRARGRPVAPLFHN
jgi:hypothetical protein